MRRNLKKFTALAAVTAMTASMMMTGCSNSANQNAATTTAATQATTAADKTQKVTDTKETSVPKYIFLFIGDGMSYPQIQSANYYLSALADTNNDDILQSKSNLSFMEFPVAGSAQTYDSSSFCPDSASTATSISTGYKTYSGTINMDETMTKKYETISEKLKTQLGYKIGVISTVNLNHATPAAFYAHQASRNSYYEIGLELVESNFDYFAGGGLKQKTGKEKDKEDLYELAKKAGYGVYFTKDEAAKAADDKMIIIDETLADGDAMSYDMDTVDGEWQLADYVSKGIEVLGEEDGFFMMVEGGKIDWACHANDAGASISDTLALNDAVLVAVDFYNKHPEETLILVTGDHETGGLTIGFAGTNYDTFLTNLENQNISYAKFDSDYVAGYKENKTDFETAMKDVKELFGLMLPGDADATEGSAMVLTDYEVEKLKAAYDRTINVGTSSQDKMTQEEYVLYGTYEPFSVTVTHILNNKSGIAFTSYSHTGLPVPVFAIGKGSELFEGYYDNTDIYNNVAALTGVK
ncbi:MAG: alkaline phosphatase [Lachnospiraceae bacterium]